MDNDMRGLVAIWSGAAATGYNTGWAETHRGADEVWSALFDLAARLGVPAETYCATELRWARYGTHRRGEVHP
ncbi:WXG100 family type VII secretion target [Nocardia tengchongensis]|uniref:WXG100 family type VII secretion target n=1 Tax=Nocardia tengchongensis TaxID=2055889 RepID=UPI00367AB16F